MRRWAYVLTGVVFAGICAWISYNDGLFVARLAGNHDTLAYFYPLLPDGLIVLCLLALAEASRKERSSWAVWGLRLGIVLTLAMNTYAGIEHSVLDAILDGMVPVVFFIAAEVVLWHVRHGRTAQPGETGGGEVPSSSVHAARMRLKVAAKHGFKVTPNDTQERFGLTRAAARGLHAEFAPKEAPAGSAPVPAGVNGNGPHGG